MKPLNFLAPGKVILFGEWDVLQGGPALALAVEPHFRLKLEPHSTSFCLFKNTSSYGPKTHFEFDSEFFKSGDFSKTDPFWLTGLVTLRFFYENLGGFKKFINNSKSGWSVEFHCEWPITFGLGSSSALVACWLSFFKSQGCIKTNNEAFELGKSCLREFQGGKGSGLDLATQLWGGSVEMEDLNPKSGKLKKIPSNLFFLRTGKKLNTSFSINSQNPPNSRFTKIRMATHRFLKSINAKGEATESAWIDAINESYFAFEGIDFIHTPDVLECRDLLFNKKLIDAFKTTGAGGGDCLMVWVPAEKQSEFKKTVSAQNLGDLYNGKFFVEGARHDH